MDNRRCDIQLTDDYINRILEYLQGWKLAPEKECCVDEYATSFLEDSEIRDAMDTSNVITRSEIEIFFQKGITEAMSYMWWDYIPPSPVVHEAVLRLTAGLIWKKYNVIHNYTDNTYPFGYGDQLIKQAKRMLKNSMRSRLRSVI